MTKFRKLDKLLSSQSSKLHSLVYRAQFLTRCNRILQNLLSAPLKNHILIGNISNETLVITVDSAVWLTKAKLQLPEIFDKFKQESGLLELKQTRISVDPVNAYVNSGSHTVTKLKQTKDLSSVPLSRTTLLQISHIANNLTDPKLKKVLQNLAKTLVNKQNK